MSDSVTFFVDVHGDGEPVDLLPLAREVLATCPFKNDLTPLELAQLTERHGDGKYIPVDIQDRVTGRKLDVLIRRVMCWARGPKRIAQLRDPDVLRLMPYISLQVSGESCPQARRMAGRVLDPDELEPLPLRGCWRSACWCAYRAHMSKDGLKPGKKTAR